MPSPKLSNSVLQATLDTFAENGFNQVATAIALGIARGTLQARLNDGKMRGIKPTINEQTVNEEKFLRNQVRELKSQIAATEGRSLTDEYVRRKIIGLVEAPACPPEWLLKQPATRNSVVGVPTLFASDWHWAEVVDPDQIGGVNTYNIKIAHERARALIDTAIDLLTNHLANPNYPGIVFPLGGDMVSGDIHEELSVTNEMEIMPTVIDLFGVLIWCIKTLADRFGKVFVPCVTGNHGRNTFKIRAKGRNHTSFDWLLYSMLKKRFEGDKRIAFLVSGGPDVRYNIYGHRYLLTHGDQFRGGDGMIGALGPILRGDHKKRSRNGQIDMGYDTMILGHWHQLIQLKRVIVNGSLKGYDEYASQNNFGFEEPQQALWITHPTHGITFSMPVNVSRRTKKAAGAWVSMEAAV